jgi:tungstate transport system substrate-binding protein
VTATRWLIAALVLAMPVAIWIHLRAAAEDRPPVLPAVVPSTIPSTRSIHASTQPTIRCAVIGGMFFTGFWTALADRYEKQTGIHVEMVVTGPKNDLIKIFKQGNVDLITMHSSDAMVNLTANGYTLDPQPWMRNDLIIVGPPDDPAGIKGMTDAAEAL